MESKDVPEGFEIVINAHPENGQTVESMTDAQIVDNTDVEITGVPAQHTLIELASGLQYDSR